MLMIVLSLNVTIVVSYFNKLIAIFMRDW